MESHTLSASYTAFPKTCENQCIEMYTKIFSSIIVGFVDHVLGKYWKQSSRGESSSWSHPKDPIWPPPHHLQLLPLRTPEACFAVWSQANCIQYGTCL